MAGSDAFDFGSCVSLHRFLYDHWDHVRQSLITWDRQEYARSPTELARGRSPILEPLRNLFAKLGPPPLAVSWNRPQILTNSPPFYSRFQNFMLSNAFKSTESFLTTRAIYDGGESKVCGSTWEIIDGLINSLLGWPLDNMCHSPTHRS